ncbi:Actin-related protein 10 [Lamellibrachia satsuma]|nr:Actin-related protein 10 [Lamellibrachia satsuma]
MPLLEGFNYGGEKTAVIFDIGAAYTKCGFAGETGPRCIAPTSVNGLKKGQVINICHCTDEKELYDLLKSFFNKLYFRHLLVNPKERRVVIVESVFCPTTFRDTLAKVLFEHYQVPSLLFAPSHLVALFTLGIPSGLVIDVGQKETQVMPVFEGVLLLKAWQALPVAGEAIEKNLEAHLLEGCNVKTDQSADKPLSSVMSSVPQSVLEDIKVRCCFVTKLSRAKQLQAVGQGTGDKDEVSVAAMVRFWLLQSLHLPLGVDYPLDGSTVLHIVGKIRENACEVLFERDAEETSVATLLLEAILKSPVDARKILAENIVVTGGTSMLLGFKARLAEELRDLREKPRYKERLFVDAFKFHSPPAKENYVAWLGGAIFGALEVLPSRSVTREMYHTDPVLPDWCSLHETEELDEKASPPKKTAATR